jgi:hypothetical protein
MMQIEYFTVILVYSTSYAFHIEKIFAMNNIPCSMIPVPRHLSSDCGVCVSINPDNKKKAEKILEKTNVPFEGIHDIVACWNMPK